MNFLLLSDCHLLYEKPRARLDDTFQTGLKKMEFILDYAAKNNCVILQAGDFFDRPRSWYLLVAYTRLFEKYRIPIYTIFGQHDQYFRSREATLLEALSAAGLVSILNGRPLLIGESIIYGAGFGEEIPEAKRFPDTEVKGRATNILVIHRMIVKKKIWPAQEDYIYAGDFLKKHEEFDLILCGDAHQKFIDISKGGGTICNSGCLIRKSVDLWNHKPGFFITDTEGDVIDWIEIPHEPAEKVLSRKHIEDEKEVNEMLESFVQAVSSESIETGTSFEDNLEAFIKENRIGNEIVDIISSVMEVKGE